MEAGRRACLVAALAGAVVEPLDQRFRRFDEAAAARSRDRQKLSGDSISVKGWLARRTLPKVDQEMTFLASNASGTS